MCTAISFLTKDHYFGRNLDLEYSYHEAVTIMPRNYPLHFRCTGAITNHYAMIGVANVNANYPLYYDATNEFGLSMAGLNFPGNAVYLPQSDCAINIAPFELIPLVLCQCKTVDEACILLKDVRIADIPYSDDYPLTPLHWIISDKSQSVTIEPMEAQLAVYKNPIGILTNNPIFPFHMENLRQYVNLTSQEPDNRFLPNSALTPFSRGLGAFGLPGDFSSASRFIRAAYVKENSVCSQDECSSVVQFFHILQSVQQPCGCIRLKSGNEKTVYSSCCNTDKGIFYYTTYENSQITALHLHHADLDGKTLTTHALRRDPVIQFVN